MLPRRNKDEKARRPKRGVQDPLKMQVSSDGSQEAKETKVNVTDIIHLQPQNKVKKNIHQTVFEDEDGHGYEIEKILPSGEALISQKNTRMVKQKNRIHW